MATAIEDRVAALEAEVNRLKANVSRLMGTGKNWLEQISGSMKDIPEDVRKDFIKYCEEIRAAGRPPEN